MIDEAIKKGGMECPNCGAWRSITEDNVIEECRYCKDDEFDYYELDFPELPVDR